MPDLKPCPFCGAKAELDVELTPRDRPKFFRIRCTNIHCGAMIVNQMSSRGPNKPKLSGNDTLEAFSAEYQKRLHAFNDWCSERAEDTVITWNRRTP
jgi:hypothetical protein